MNLPKISVLNDFLDQQFKELKVNFNNGYRGYAKQRNNILNNSLFMELKTDCVECLTFKTIYADNLKRARSIYELGKVIKDIQLTYTARMSGKAIAEQF